MPALIVIAPKIKETLKDIDNNWKRVAISIFHIFNLNISVNVCV